MRPRPTPSEEVTRVGSSVSKDTTPEEGQMAPLWWWCLWVSCVGGRRYFPYYSYRRNPTGREFFVPARTQIAVKLLRFRFSHNLSYNPKAHKHKHKHSTTKHNRKKTIYHKNLFPTVVTIVSSVLATSVHAGPSGAHFQKFEGNACHTKQ